MLKYSVSKNNSVCKKQQNNIHSVDIANVS